MAHLAHSSEESAAEGPDRCHVAEKIWIEGSILAVADHKRRRIKTGVPIAQG